MRIGLWQTFQRNIEGIPVWETTYGTSNAAYLHAEHPQIPYPDPMNWTSGYSTPTGERLPSGNGDRRFIYPPLAAADAKGDSPVLEGTVDSSSCGTGSRITNTSASCAANWPNAARTCRRTRIKGWSSYWKGPQTYRAAGPSLRRMVRRLKRSERRWRERLQHCERPEI